MPDQGQPNPRVPKIKPVSYSGHIGNASHLATSEFTQWLNQLPEKTTRLRILARIDRLFAGLAGDSKSVGGGVQELRLNFGSGYRVYFLKSAGGLILLLLGGDKSSQHRDIPKAQSLASQWRRGQKGSDNDKSIER
ncbi:MAG TPA: type II toxin-antitoxin system RelE/ParE family toxin [Aeromicrobium sp.]|nr:type II toxin-antitoxin system RelE/ParE family toxin [Aeromicrobium sp.]